MIHELKTLPQYFNAVRSGAKTFEVRKNDRNFQTWDMVILKEFIPSKGFGEGRYSGNEILAFITYILDNEEYLQPGFVVLALSIQNKWHKLATLESIREMDI